MLFLRITEYSLAVKAVVSQTVLHFASEKQLLDFPFYTWRPKLHLKNIALKYLFFLVQQSNLKKTMESKKSESGDVSVSPFSCLMCFPRDRDHLKKWTKFSLDECHSQSDIICMP